MICCPWGNRLDRLRRRPRAAMTATTELHAQRGVLGEIYVYTFPSHRQHICLVSLYTAQQQKRVSVVWMKTCNGQGRVRVKSDIFSAYVSPDRRQPESEPDQTSPTREPSPLETSGRTCTIGSSISCLSFSTRPQDARTACSAFSLATLA